MIHIYNRHVIIKQASQDPSRSKSQHSASIKVTGSTQIHSIPMWQIRDESKIKKVTSEKRQVCSSFVHLLRNDWI